MLVLMAAAAIAAAGFTRAPVLEPAAAYVAGVQVQVMCASNNDAWETAKAQASVTGNAWGFHIPGTNLVFIHPNGCRLMRAEARNRDLTTEPLLLRAGFVVTLVHESLHIRWPLATEGWVDCEAIHEAPGVMVKFFHVKPGKMLRQWMAAAWVVHRSSPPQYTSVC